MTERRRAFRLRMVIPVTITWTTKSGEQITEEAVTEEVNAYGAMLRVKTHRKIPARFWLMNPANQKQVEGLAVRLSGHARDGSVRVAVALSSPCEIFWSLRLPTAVTAPLPAVAEELDY